MKKQGCLFSLIIVLLMAAMPSLGCLWDGDTLAAEQARFPEAAQLITGTFPRHSREFHEWRVKECERLIDEKKDVLSTHDDLAVSQHKLGDHKAAIGTMNRKEKLFPGVYETYSNLGTFYIYTGQLDESMRYIHKALAINENAHFGREKYQLWLVEWLLSQKKEGPDEPGSIREVVEGEARGFARFLITKGAMNEKKRGEAVRGVLGMMWFADHDNPLLLEALGDLLIFGKQETNAAQLAALSYLHASRKTTEEAEKKRLMRLSEMAVRMSHGFEESGRLTELLDRGLAKGREYLEGVRKDEMAWIAAGEDAAALFQKKYLVR
jgi:tetratricopeptide (TPR) repeat protein